MLNNSIKTYGKHAVFERRILETYKMPKKNYITFIDVYYERIASMKNPCGKSSCYSDMKVRWWVIRQSYLF